MQVQLTQEALGALREMHERLQQSSPGKMAICLVWAWQMSEPGPDGAFRDHGPGLFVGAVDANPTPSGYQRMEQDGLAYLLALPAEIRSDRDPDPANQAALIDFNKGKFFFL